MSFLISALFCAELTADVGFILDSSFSLRKRYNDEKYFVKALAGLFANGNVKTSVITFSSYTRLSIKFSDSKNTPNFNNAVDAIPLIGLQTRIDKALKQAKYEMFTRQNGARYGIQKILILLTDGAQTGRANLARSADVLRKEGVKLVVIGIGKKVDVNELKTIAGRNERYYTVNSFDELISDDFIKSVATNTCPGKPAEHLRLTRHASPRHVIFRRHTS